MEAKNSGIIETERLWLRPTNEDDASFILKLLNTPKWLEFIGDRNVHSLEDAKNYIRKKIAPQYKKLGYGNYTVIRKSDNKKLGSCGLYDRPGIEGVDLGFAFLPEYEKKGYAYESASKIMLFAKKHFSLNNLQAITVEANESSQNLLKKLGFQFEKYVQLEDDDEMLLLFKTTAE